MSARNGDKSRFHRLRKAKIQRRLRTEMLASLATTQGDQPAPEAHAPHASESEPEKHSAGPLAAAAKTIGSVLGAVAAKTGIAHKADADPAQPES